jgi:hypothetical protein|tara:strand:+ start:523 stop:855 length:333 start_codon:yes stop_codon:yes gene_type:complete
VAALETEFGSACDWGRSVLVGTIMSILLILIFGFLAVVSLAVAINIWGAGPGQIRDLRKLGYGWSVARNANLPKSESITTANAKAGIEFSARDGKIVNFKRTRTISDNSA